MVAAGDLSALAATAMTSGRPILTTTAMITAEQRAIEAGTSVETLMERAGAGLAEAAYRYAGRMPALFLVGPGNNGGDGYVAAGILPNAVSRSVWRLWLIPRVTAPNGPAHDGPGGRGLW